jgi:hypothetical protein
VLTENNKINTNKKSPFRSLSLRAKYFSSLLTTSAQHFTAILRAHSFTEAMILLALTVIRVKRRTHLSHLLEDIHPTKIL